MVERGFESASLPKKYDKIGEEGVSGLFVIGGFLSDKS